MQEIEGLTVAYLSGGSDPVLFKDKASAFRTTKYEAHYVQDDVTRLVDKYNATSPGLGVDLLLTSEWGRLACTRCCRPRCCPMGLKHTAASTGSSMVKALCMQKAARCHFAGTTGLFFQLPPYTNIVQGCTRFLGIGKVGAGQEAEGPLRVQPERGRHGQAAGQRHRQPVPYPAHPAQQWARGRGSARLGLCARVWGPQTQPGRTLRRGLRVRGQELQPLGAGAGRARPQEAEEAEPARGAAGGVHLPQVWEKGEPLCRELPDEW